MSDGQLLLLILWLVYVTDCFLWLNKHSIAFVSWWGLKWDVATASTVFGSGSGGLLFLNPFPPLGRFCLNQLLPVSISPEFITAFNSQTVASGGRPQQSGEVIALSDIQNVSVNDTELLLNGRLFCKYRNQAALAVLVRLLDAIRVKRPDQRIPLIEAFWTGQLKLARARKEQASIHRKTTTLRILCKMQFLYLFLFLPVAMSLHGVSQFIIPAAIVMEIIAIQVAVLYFMVHKGFYPKAVWERAAHVIKIVLCPPVCIRVVDLIRFNSHARDHALTLACLLLPSPAGAHFTGRMLRDLRHPIKLPANPPEIADVCWWQNATIERLAAQCLPAVAECVELLARDPDREEPGSRSFCPRCLAQLSIEDAECPDCPGVGLKSFVHPITSGQPLTPS